MQIEKILATSMLFGRLAEDDLHQIAALAQLQKYRKKEPIFFEGAAAAGFYLVVSGKVRIFKAAESGKEQILHIFGTGNPFGEAAVFHGTPFPASAEALTEAEVLFFPKDAFRALITANPELCLNMLAMLSMRLRNFTKQIEALTLKEVPARIAGHLLFLSTEQKSKEKIELDIPKGHLASLLGTSAETLSRVFAKMTDDGLIRVDGRTIHLLDYKGLAAMQGI